MILFSSLCFLFITSFLLVAQLPLSCCAVLISWQQRKFLDSLHNKREVLQRAGLIAKATLMLHYPLLNEAIEVLTKQILSRQTKGPYQLKLEFWAVTSHMRFHSGMGECYRSTTASWSSCCSVFPPHTRRLVCLMRREEKSHHSRSSINGSEFVLFVLMRKREANKQQQEQC